MGDSLIFVLQGPADKDTKKRIKQKQNSDEEYELSRYKPLLRIVLEVRLHSVTRNSH